MVGYPFVAALLLIAVTLVPQPAQADEGKVVIGEVEQVMLLPWQIKFPARIDTGAAISSLDASELSVRNDVAHFKLRNEFGEVPLKLPVVGWRNIRTSEGRERRPLVKLDICLGPKHLITLVTLNDRSRMTYPFLIGRTALTGNFLVDTSQSNAVQPQCSEGFLRTSSLSQ